MKVLVVDDSLVFRSRIKKSLDEVDEINLVDTATNGKLALQKLSFTKYDLMILDVEMPEMDGIETLKKIKEKEIDTRIIMFSAATSRSADLTLTALSLGASDFIIKPTQANDINEALDKLRSEIIPKLLQFTDSVVASEATQLKTVVGSSNMTSHSELPHVSGKLYSNMQFEPDPNWTKNDLSLIRPQCIVIGSSTGGPVAMRKLFETIKGQTSIPIIVCQHMPPLFTTTLAQNISKQTGVACKELTDGEIIESNHIYVAAGDFHLSLFRQENLVRAKLDQRERRNSVRPAVDYLFESAAKIFERHVLAFVLTGMGQDGLWGCKAIKDSGGTVVIQDEQSSVVWGMPGAVHHHKCYDYVKSIERCSEVLSSVVERVAT